MRIFALLLAVAWSSQAQNFLSVSAGISTLSADGAKTGSPATALSQYKPENGPSVSIAAGRDFSDWWSAQVGYGWNRNSAVLSGSAGLAAYDVPVRASMHTILAEAMLYFRPRASRIRPYLSAGPGIAMLRAQPSGTILTRATTSVPSATFEANSFAFRVAVGIDVQIRGPLAFRYTFGETLEANAFSKQLIPAGSRNLANFQNQWGIAWRF